MCVYEYLHLHIRRSEWRFLNLLTYKVQKLRLFTIENGKLLSSFLICFYFNSKYLCIIYPKRSLYALLFFIIRYFANHTVTKFTKFRLRPTRRKTFFSSHVLARYYKYEQYVLCIRIRLFAYVCLKYAEVGYVFSSSRNVFDQLMFRNI